MEHLPRGELDAHIRPTIIDGTADPLERDSGGQVQPHYVFVPRAAGRLACGELAIEPVLRAARVTGIVREERSPFVHIAWADEYGPSHAAGRYPADRILSVRTPGLPDHLLIRRAIDLAARRRREISGAVARLIAAHLHTGPRSALYRFAVNGAAPEPIYDELEHISRSQTAFRSWASALAAHCLNRVDTGPVPGWGAEHTPQTTNAKTANGRGHKTSSQPSVPKRLPSETAMQLIDAAFALGVAASRSEVAMAKARWIIRQHEGATL